MTELRTTLLRVADMVRSIPGPLTLWGDEGLGLRATELQIIERSWSGKKGAKGSIATDDILTIVPTPYVESLAGQETASSAGRYQEGDVKISSLTPAYDGYFGLDHVVGGYTPEQLKPMPTDNNADIIYRLTGPDPGDYALTDSDFITDNCSYYLWLRRTRLTP
jgi:hypothetical protein